MDNVKIGKFIASLRKGKGLTQAALAQKLNISNRTVSKWETGDGLPDISILPELACELGVSTDELLAGERKSASPEIKVTEIANDDNIKNTFQILSAVSLFLAIFSALLGGFTGLYGIWAFNVLFFNHWEIIFDALSFCSLLISMLIFTVGVIRLRLNFDERQVKASAMNKGALIGLIGSVFICSFIGRIIDHILAVSGFLARFIANAGAYHGNIAAYICTALIFGICVIVYICIIKEEERQKNEKSD